MSNLTSFARNAATCLGYERRDARADRQRGPDVFLEPVRRILGDGTYLWRVLHVFGFGFFLCCDNLVDLAFVFAAAEGGVDMVAFGYEDLVLVSSVSGHG